MDKKIETLYIKIDNSLDKEAVLKAYASELDKAGEILKRGGLVAFPTETVYGLGGNALDSEASKKIYRAKGRPSDNPLIVHISEESELAPLVENVPATARLLMQKYWPGPMTLIFNKSDLVPSTTTGGLDTVAVRMPSNPIASALIKKAGVPIAAPSANLSGRPSPTSATHVREDMDGRVDMIIDGGDSDIGLESTIIDVTGEMPVILRPGFISLEELKQIDAQAKIDPAILEKPTEDFHPKAPGMKYRHYAPKAPMTIVVGEEEAVVNKINELIEEAKSQGKDSGIICPDEHKKLYESEKIVVIGNIKDEASVAHNLFAVLRKMDELDVDEIFAEGVQAKELGTAIMNRMTKAAGYNVIEV